LSAEELLAGLDDEQKKAVTLETNGVIAAGAGSGKTRVLASRYAWLITERNLKPEEILTLTFTNKAVSEMYGRIYSLLLNQKDEKALDALRNFHKARIGTLDSFSANVARTAAARYGISPDFKSDDTALRDLAGEAALKFVLDNREAPAIRQLLVDHKIRDIAEKIFAGVVLNFSPISSPPDFGKHLSAQKETLLRVWKEYAGAAERTADSIVDALLTLAETKKSGRLIQSLNEILLRKARPPLPDITPLLEAPLSKAPFPEAAETRQQVKEYIDFYFSVTALNLSGGYGEAYQPLLKHLRTLKGNSREENGIFRDLEAAANYALNFGLCAGACGLIKQFRDEFNVKKRETGLLSFNDIARLAVDILKDHPDIRKVYKDSLRMIMVDEFQDNNALQRDLVYLLAEDPARNGKGIAPPQELEDNRMFFVGDEKQSIYRFRGADVAVFRSLGRNLFGGPGEGSVELTHNYRSRPRLIAAFNRIFGGLEDNDDAGRKQGVFMAPPANAAANAAAGAIASVPDYEAVYSRLRPPENKSGGPAGFPAGSPAGSPAASPADPGETGPLARFCFLNEEALPKDDKSGIKPQDLEAVFIAGRIRDMVRNREKIPRRKNNKTEWEECRWEDFCVLERSYTHQSALEKYFREFAVPYNTDRPSGLSDNAPIPDLLACLRLIAYPEDRIAYAALIRSPFTRLGDLSLAACMLNQDAEPFAEENEAVIPEEDRPLYRRARERYLALREASRTLSTAELITRLWFEEGCRYETLWPESARANEGLFDLFFSLACEADARGRSLADFVKFIDGVMKREEKPDDKDIPGEGEGGVRIMSIHKSKGLEFPVVFIFNCAKSGNSRNTGELADFHEDYGLILKIPQAEGMPFGGNYFGRAVEREEAAKDNAELRRLLYVAMTRAECGLFLTFTLPRQSDEEAKTRGAEGGEFDEALIRRRLSALDEISETKRETFLTLLRGVLPDCPPSLCAIEVIPALTRDEISLLAADSGKDSAARRPGIPGRRAAALAAAPFYEKAALLPVGKAGPESLEASKLRGGGGVDAPGNGRGETETAAGLGPEDAILGKAGLNPAEFGSLVHAFLEGRLTGRGPSVPSKIRSRVNDEKALKTLEDSASAMADAFIASGLGKRWASAARRESEFPVITSVDAGGKAVAVTGQIDLLFEENGSMVIIDFKTDRTENPEAHYGQLAAYSRAVGDIFGKPVSVWLYYLRSGRQADATEGVKLISLEELAAEALLN
jgi:ATP-dependent helicase/nuclease subunit A